MSQTDDYGHGTQMRNFKIDPSPKSGWSYRYRYILVAIDSEDPLGLTPKSSVMQPESGLRMEGDMCFVRLSKTGKVHYMCFYGGKFISIGNAEARLDETNNFSEIIAY